MVKKILILQIGDQESIEGDESFEGTILKNKRASKDDDVNINIFKLDDLETFLSEDSEYNSPDKHQEITKILNELQAGDKIYILSHGRPNSVMIGNSTHYSILANYLAKGLNAKKFKQKPIQISLHSCRSGKGSMQGKNSFAGLLHNYLGKLQINSEVTARTELVYIDKAKYSSPNSGVMTITPTKHFFSIVYSLLNLKVPDNWYKYKKPGTKVKFFWDKQGKQNKSDHYISKYNNAIFDCLEELTTYYNGQYYTNNIKKLITNIQGNLYKENYQTVSNNITKLLFLIQENKNPTVQQIYQKLLKYNQNILIKHKNSFKTKKIKEIKFNKINSSHVVNHTNIEQLVNNQIARLDIEINKIDISKLNDNEIELIKLLKIMRNDLYKHLRHQYIFPYIPKFSITQAIKIIQRVTDVTHTIFNKYNKKNIETLKIKKIAVENFIKQNAEYLKSSKLLRIKYIFAGIKEGIIEAIKDGGKETLANILIKAIGNAKFRESYFHGYGDQLKSLTKNLNENLKKKPERASKSPS